MSSSAPSTACVTSSVLEPYWLSMVRSTPGRPWINASPKRGAPASTTRATSARRTLTTGAPRHLHLPQHAGVDRLALRLEDDALVGRVDEARTRDAGRRTRRRQDVGECEPVTEQTVGLHLDLELPYLAPEHGHLGDAGDRE